MLEKLRSHWNSKNREVEKHGSADEVIQDDSAFSGEATASDAEHQVPGPLSSTAAAVPRASQDDAIAPNERRGSRRLSSFLRRRSSSASGKATDSANTSSQQPDSQPTSSHKLWHGIPGLGNRKNDESASKSMPEEHPESSTSHEPDQTAHGIA